MKNIPQSGDYSSSFNKFIFDEIKEGTSVLDVGCFTGNLGEKLILEKKCDVDGVEVNKNVIKKAKDKGYKDVFEINLNNTPLPQLINKKYDVIVFADVLEHLIDPPAILNYFSKNLVENGKIVISLPNVAFLLNRINLLLGKWNYTEFGTLDKTHLKFYTLFTGKKLLEETNFEIEKLYGYNQFGILKYTNFLMPYFEKFLGYQFIMVGRKKNG